MNNYRNDVKNDYEKSIKLNDINNIIFAVHLIFLAINAYKEVIPQWIIVLLCFIYILLGFIDDLFLLNKAEKERRKTLVSDAYNKNLSDKKTKKYYNNSVSPSVKKLGVDSFESSYYTKENLGIMLKTSGIKVLITLVAFFTFVFVCDNKKLIILLFETLFSTDILYRYIKMVYYKFEVNNIYNIFFHIFVSNKYTDNNEAELICNVMDYECIKNYCHIQLSEKNFNKINNSKKNKWNEIKKEIK